jgi:hypothetical protein
MALSYSYDHITLQVTDVTSQVGSDGASIIRPPPPTRKWYSFMSGSSKSSTERTKKVLAGEDSQLLRIALLGLQKFTNENE